MGDCLLSGKPSLGMYPTNRLTQLSLRSISNIGVQVRGLGVGAAAPWLGQSHYFSG